MSRTLVAVLGIALLACTNAADTKTKPPPPDLPPLDLPLVNRLVFGKSGAIVTTLLDGSDLRRLSLAEEAADCAALSPDSRSIVFSSTLDTHTYHWSVFLTRANGTERSKLVDLQNYSLCPFWSSDGNHIAFEEVFASDTSNTFYVYSSDGHQEANFATLGRLTGFSPGGDRLVYFVPHFGTQSYASDIYTVRVDGSDTKWIATGGFPSWAKNVDLIAFECDGLCLMAGDGSQLRKIVNDHYVVHPVISPDGKLIAYACTSAYLCVVASDGSPVARVSDAHTPLWVRFSWSADSRRIAYECEYVTAPGSTVVETREDICTVNADGTGFRNLTNDKVGDAFADFSILML